MTKYLDNYTNMKRYNLDLDTINRNINPLIEINFKNNEESKKAVEYFLSLKSKKIRI